jgi:mono/diheme cytochrome c family protein
MKIKILLFNVAAIGLMIIFMATTFQQKPWVVPAAYKSKKNPVKSTPASISAGKLTWEKQCKSCHGSAGKGDGVKAKTLKTACGDFSLVKFQSQLDGEIYYKSFVGRDEMPNFEKKVTDETERWNLINFVRSLKK